MCGIFGSINYSLKKEHHNIFRDLFHRGPNQQNFVVKGNVELLHTRLAIQDLTPSGCQPMIHNGLYIAFNGEIYNHFELRTKFNLQHPSRSDTMTILLMYEKLGIGMLKEFDGMFAFCLYDTNNEKVYLARDRTGKKPLYIWQKNDSMVFSSELNVLRKITNPDINKTAINDYLYLGFHYKRQTPFESISELEDGCYKEFNLINSEQKNERWFDITSLYLNKLKLSEGEALHQLDSKLNHTVKCRLESSDVEVGSFLSGGIEPTDAGLVKDFMKDPVAKDLLVVDINSRFELAPGIKDLEKVKQFICELKNI